MLHNVSAFSIMGGEWGRRLSSHCCQGSSGWVAEQLGSGQDTVLKGMTHCPASLSGFHLRVLPPCCVFDREFISSSEPSDSFSPPVALLLAKQVPDTWEPVGMLHIRTSTLPHAPLTLLAQRAHIEKMICKQFHRVSNKLHAVPDCMNERRGSFGMDGREEDGAGA